MVGWAQEEGKWYKSQPFEWPLTQALQYWRKQLNTNQPPDCYIITWLRVRGRKLEWKQTKSQYNKKHKELQQVLIRSLGKDDTDDSKKVFRKCTSHFCNHISIVQNNFACKMSSNYPGIKLEPALQKMTKLNICHHIVKLSTQPQNRSFHVLKKKGNIYKMCKNEKCSCKSLQNNCFLLSNTQICDVLVAVVIMDA